MLFSKTALRYSPVALYSLAPASAAVRSMRAPHAPAPALSPPMASEARRGFAFRPPRRVRQNSRSPGRQNLSPVPPQQAYDPIQEMNSNLTQLKQHLETVQKPEEPNLFAFDSTFTLAKKLLIYKLMGSNLFINYSLVGIQAAYKLLGIRLTNFTIEQTAGSVFTGGVTVEDLVRETAVLEERGIGTIGCYVVEGLRQTENSRLDAFFDFSVDAVRAISANQAEGHFALKLTAYVSTELMEKLSQA